MDFEIQFEKCHPQTPNINSLVILRLLLQHLWSYIEWASHKAISRRSFLQTPEIGNLEALFNTDNVLRLDIPVDHTP